jgi:hypothetical protein
MTKEDYISEIRRINDERARLQERAKAIEIAYIEEHKEYDKGDKVRLHVNERQHPFLKGKTLAASYTDAYVRSVYESGGVIKYTFDKARKDGSRSLQPLGYNSYHRIELLEKVKPTNQ